MTPLTKFSGAATGLPGTHIQNNEEVAIKLVSALFELAFEFVRLLLVNCACLCVELVLMSFMSNWLINSC